ncbi:MAG: hypothetical protein ACPGO3_03785 [Magnetospiraceae bacterium]
MLEAVLGLVAAYVALGLLCLNLWFQSRWPLWVKAGTVALVSLFYYVTYDSLLGMLGWPTEARLPAVSMVLGSYVIEPDPETGADGRIYVWADDVSDGTPLGKPRAYELPYDADVHERLFDAQRNARNGIFQILSTEDSEAVENATALSGLLGTADSQRLTIRDLPDPALPGK